MYLFAGEARCSPLKRGLGGFSEGIETFNGVTQNCLSSSQTVCKMEGMGEWQIQLEER